MTSIETRQLPRTKPQPRSEERNKNLLKKRPKPVKKTLKERSSVTRTSKRLPQATGQQAQRGTKHEQRRSSSDGGGKRTKPQREGERERERRETTPRAEGQRAAVFSFSPFPEIPHYSDKKPPRWMTNLIFMNIKSHLC